MLKHQGPSCDQQMLHLRSHESPLNWRGRICIRILQRNRTSRGERWVRREMIETNRFIVRNWPT